MEKELIIECIALLNTANFQDTLNIKRDEIVNKLKEQLLIQRVVGSLPASKDEALSKRKTLADKYYRNDPCESAFALGFINCYEWLERIIKT